MTQRTAISWEGNIWEDGILKSLLAMLPGRSLGLLKRSILSWSKIAVGPDNSDEPVSAVVSLFYRLNLDKTLNIL